MYNKSCDSVIKRFKLVAWSTVWKIQIRRTHTINSSFEFALHASQTVLISTTQSYHRYLIHTEYGRFSHTHQIGALLFLRDLVRLPPTHLKEGTTPNPGKGQVTTTLRYRPAHFDAYGINPSAIKLMGFVVTLCEVIKVVRLQFFVQYCQ